MLDYGIIGNCLTSALIKKDASIDWWCYPHFSSPSIFAKILDPHSGSFTLSSRGSYTITQRYVPHTAILETTFTGKQHAFVVLDFFPRYKSLLPGHNGLQSHNWLIRMVKPLRGTPEVCFSYNPKPDYARASGALFVDGGALQCTGSSVSLVSNVPYASLIESRSVLLDRMKYFVIGDIAHPHTVNAAMCARMLRSTTKYWEEWCRSLTVPDLYQEEIIRSALTLKLLTFSLSGAIVAAPTASLPEQIGTARTFDYRFCWVRDAVMTVDALNKLGRDYESKRLIEFIMGRAFQDDHIQLMYGIHGETDIEEHILPHLAGYARSRPVRVGNAAYLQEQNDIYGALLDIMYLYFVYYQYDDRLTHAMWLFVRRLVNHIRFHWYHKDSGIWEFRGQEQHFTYSKLMCFVGVDRAIMIAQHFQHLEYIPEWTELRHKIREDILQHGYRPKSKAFTMYYGSDALDASLLQMTYHEFLDRTDVRIHHTVQAVYRTLRDRHLVSRYRVRDDFGVSKSAFAVCSFWLVDALFYIGEIDKARSLYTRMARTANHLGLFSEDIDRISGRQLGNFPQAYTHTAHINSSILLSEWATKRKKIASPPTRRRWH